MFSILKMNCILEPAEGLGGLFLGDIDAATDMKLLDKHNIKAVLTTAAGTRITYRKEAVPEHHIIAADDIESFNLGKFFERGIEFIDRCRRAGLNVLVHCFAGVSRSATITIAYLMKMKKMTFVKAHEFTKSRRRIIFPNNGFKNQLREYERKLKQLEKDEAQREAAQREVPSSQQGPMTNGLGVPSTNGLIGQPTANVTTSNLPMVTGQNPFLHSAVQSLQNSQVPGMSTNQTAPAQGSGQQIASTSTANGTMATSQLVPQSPSLAINGLGKSSTGTNGKMMNSPPGPRPSAITPGTVEKKNGLKSETMKAYIPPNRLFSGATANANAMTTSLPPLSKDGQSNFTRVTQNGNTFRKKLF